jgi:hypothetical protein
VQPSDHLVFGVRLPYVDLESEPAGAVLTQLDQVGVGRVTVDVGFPRAEAPQIRPVEDDHLHDETSW